jgi:DnaJ-class molecular chaperone
VLYHPDKQTDPDKQAQAEKVFQTIQTAYTGITNF